MKIFRNYKRKGFSNLVIAVFTAGLVGFTALNVTKLHQTGFSGLLVSRDTVEAQDYALAKADYLKTQGYSDLVQQAKTKITGTTDFYDEVTVSAESNYQGDSSVKQKLCTINVYKGSESSPSYSIQICRLSVEGGTSTESLPVGSILAWTGTTSNIPNGYSLCNGSNGTPDLRNRFIVGAGSTYALGATGGANTVTLSAAQVGNHYHAYGYHTGNNNGRMLSTAGTTKNYSLASGTTGASWNGRRGGANSGESTSSLNLITSLPVSTAASEAHENRPPYYALFFIMKTE